MDDLKICIRLTTNFAVPGRKEGSFSLPSSAGTLRRLLLHLGEKIRFDLVDPRGGSLETDLEILLNGKDFRFLPRGLDTPLSEGDALDVHLLPLGGG